ncbi:MAG: carbohydrate kinase [Tannerella sp.]|jgi:fructokinase|nr:carbohydrate kinase [Tannerella sp.]
MRKVIGIGETILDVIFRDDRPHVAVPGGSTFNCMVSLSRLGLPVAFISELGNDRVGEMIRNFMQSNGMTTEYIGCFPDRKSPVSLAFLNRSKDAEYIFYTDYPLQRLDVPFPVINEDDILVFGSFYALNGELHERITDLLEYAKLRKAIIYYDPNFRKTHAHEAIRVRSTVMDNYEYAGIVRGSDEDFFNLYGKTDMDIVYREEVEFYCKRLITTHGAGGVNLYTEKIRAHFDVAPVTPLSTVGAGDNFNAGIIYGLIKYGVGYHDLPQLGERTWEKIIRHGMEFASEVCLSYDNYISTEFAAKYGIETNG